MKDYIFAVLIGILATAVTFGFGSLVGWFADGIDWFEVAASTLNYASTYLAIKQRRAFYMIGTVASIGYAVVFASAGLLASAVLNIYLVGSLIYGYFRWGKDDNTRPVHHLGWRWSPVYLLATAAIWGGAFWITHAFGGVLAGWDAGLLVLTVLAQLMLDQKVIETWYVWTAVNVIGVILYFTSGLYFAAVQQFVFGIANLWGYLAWRKTINA